MVLDAGELKEFDTAANLLNTPGSIFASMVDDTGVESAKHLRQVWRRARQRGASVLRFGI